MSDPWNIVMRHKKYIAPLLIVVILFTFSGQLLSIIPGGEGVRAYNYGVQQSTYGNIYVASTMQPPLPTNYFWESNQPSAVVLKHQMEGTPPFGGYLVANNAEWWYDNDGGQLRSEVQRPLLNLGDPLDFDTKQVIYHKYVKKADNQVEITKVVVDIVPADFIIQLSCVTGKGAYNWEGHRLWYVLDTVSWLNAYASQPPPDPDPLTNETTKYISSNFRGAFPITGWIDEYDDWVWMDESGNRRSLPPDDNALAFVQLDPSLEGRYIDLYRTPSSKYTLLLSAETVQDEELLERALQPTWLPDPRFAETVYFPITLESFGPYVKPTGVLGSYSSYETWHPSVYYRLRVVYAMYGEYVYLWTAEEAKSVGYTSDKWEVRETTKTSVTDPVTGIFQGLDAWLANPFNVAGLAGFAALLFVLALVVVMF